MAALAVLRLAACGVTAPAMVDGFRIQPLPPAKAHFLLHTWSKTAYDARANGFRPQMEATGEMATKLKALAEELPRLAAQANVLGLCERGSMRFDVLAEPHASAGERLAKTRLVAALSAGKGSALAFVSEWEERVSIDACVVNPAFLVAGEGAERTLIRHVAREAAAAGVRCVRLLPAFQVEGVGFYEACGFFPVEGGEGELEYRAE